MKKVHYVFATCTDIGWFIELLHITQDQIIQIGKEETEDGVFYLKYKKPGQEDTESVYFIQYIKIKE